MAETRPKVIVRIRPPVTDIELADESQPFAIDDDEVHYRDNYNAEKRVRFDRAMGPDVGDEEVTREIVPKALAAITHGLGCTILHYGQSGSGKTYTMASCVRNDMIQGLLDFGRSKPPGHFELMLAVVQVHREDLTDCLQDKTPPIELKWENGAYVPKNARWVECTSLQTTVEYIMEADDRRATACTKLNTNSSRSHLVIFFRVRWLEGNLTRISRVALVDLAGSENIKDSGVTGDALHEAISINESLTNLNKVLKALIEHSRPPYRDNILTKLLMTSMTTSWMTVVLCLSPSAVYHKESLNTLRFGMRCLQIKVKPKREVQANDPNALRTILGSGIYGDHGRNDHLQTALEDRDRQQNELASELALRNLNGDANKKESGLEDDEAENALLMEVLAGQKEALEEEVRQRERAESKLEELKYTLERKQSELLRRNSAGDEAVGQLATLSAEIAKLSKSNADLQNRLDSNDDTQKQLLLLQKRMADHDTALQAARDAAEKAQRQPPKESEEARLRARELEKQAAMREAALSQRDDDVKRLKQELDSVRGELRDAERRADDLEALLRGGREARSMQLAAPEFVGALDADLLEDISKKEVKLAKRERETMAAAQTIREMKAKLPPEVLRDSGIDDKLQQLEQNLRRLRRDTTRSIKEHADEAAGHFEDKDTEGYKESMQDYSNTLKDASQRYKNVQLGLKTLHDAMEKLGVHTNGDFPGAATPPDGTPTKNGRSSRRATIDLASMTGALLREVEQAADLAINDASASPPGGKGGRNRRGSRARVEVANARFKDEIEALLDQLPASAETLIAKISPVSTELLHLLGGCERMAERMPNSTERFEIVRLWKSAAMQNADIRRQMVSEYGKVLRQAVVGMLNSGGEGNTLVALRAIQASVLEPEDAELGCSLWEDQIERILDLLLETNNQQLMTAACDALTAFAGSPSRRASLCTRPRTLQMVSSILEYATHDIPQVMTAIGRLSARVCSEPSVDSTTLISQIIPQMADCASTDARAATEVAGALVSGLLSGNDEVKDAIRARIASSEVLGLKVLEAAAIAMIRTKTDSISIDAEPDLHIHGKALNGEWCHTTTGGTWTADSRFLDNPQYILRVKQQCDVALVVSDPHKGLRSSLRSKGTNKAPFLSLAVYRYVDENLAARGLPCIRLDPGQAVSQCETSWSERNTLLVNLPPGTYVVVPGNHERLMGPYQLAVCAAKKIEFTPADMGEVEAHSFEMLLEPGVPNAVDRLLRPQWVVTPPEDARTNVALGQFAVCTTCDEADRLLERLHDYDIEEPNTTKELCQMIEDEHAKLGPLHISAKPAPIKLTELKSYGGGSHGDPFRGTFFSCGAGELCRFGFADGSQSCFVKVAPRAKKDDETNARTLKKETPVTVRFYTYIGATVEAREPWRTRLDFSEIEGIRGQSHNVVIPEQVAAAPFVVCLTSKLDLYHSLWVNGTSYGLTSFPDKDFVRMMFAQIPATGRETAIEIGFCPTEDAADAKKERNDRVQLSIFSDCVLESTELPFGVLSASRNATLIKTLPPFGTLDLGEGAHQHHFYDAESLDVLQSVAKMETIGVKIQDGDVVHLSDGRLVLVKDATRGQVVVLAVKPRAREVFVDLGDAWASYAVSDSKTNQMLLMPHGNRPSKLL